MFLCAALTLLNIEAAAQQKAQVKTSALTRASMPDGAIFWEKEKRGKKFDAVATKLFAKYESVATVGETEAYVWKPGNVRTEQNLSLTDGIKKNLKSAGWKIIAEENYDEAGYGEFLLADDANHLIAGFVVPSDEIYVLTLAQLLPVKKNPAAIGAASSRKTQ